MWSEKQRKYQKNICSKLMLAILLLASVITLTACRSSNIKETTKQTDHKTKKWVCFHKMFIFRMLHLVLT